MIRAVTNYGDPGKEKRRISRFPGDSLCEASGRPAAFSSASGTGALGGDTGLHEIRRAGSAAVCRQPRASA